MPKGFGTVRGAADDIETRKNAGGGGGKLFFKLADGETAVVRFLEQDDDVAWAWVHQLPPADGQQYGRKVVCRNQDENGNFSGDDCPGCEKNYKRQFQGAINLIWRNAPVFERDAQNRMVRDEKNKPVIGGKADQVAVWVAGVTVFADTLDVKNSKYKGLKSRDFEVTRRGTGLNTSYSIEPVDPDAGPQPMSKADGELEKEKYDLAYYTEKPAYDVWGKSPENTQTPAQTTTPSDTSPFMRSR
jgi:hypothetical protein